MTTRTLLPPPFTLGLPDKFTSWYPPQEYALDLILNPPTRFLALGMPTGAGKSLVYMAGATLGTGRWVCLTANKHLQDQLGEDFSSLGIADIRGQGSYPCKALLGEGEWSHLNQGLKPNEATCEQGPCHAGLGCTLKEYGCEAFDRLRIAEKARIVTSNYALWMAQKRYGKGVGDPDVVVLDEAHRAADELAGALTIELSYWLTSALGINTLPMGASVGQWAEWALFQAAKLRRALDAPPAVTAKALKYRRWQKQAERTLWAMSKMDPSNWIEDSTGMALRFEILYPQAHAEELLFQGAKTVVLLSATLTHKTLNLLGIPPEQVTFWECPSPFPIQNRLVYHVPTVSVKFSNSPAQDQMLVTRFDQYVTQRPGRKGLGHTVSYKRAKMIYDRSEHKDRLHLHVGGEENAAQVVQTLKLAPPVTGYTLLSPVVDMGVDLPDDDCRFQVIFKLPFPSTQSKIVQARTAVDPDYVPNMVAQRLMQSVGRGVRRMGDWCDTVILDDNWVWFRKKYAHLLSKWFTEACRTSKTLPPPYQP